MPQKLTARVLTGVLTIVFLTQPGFAAERVRPATAAKAHPAAKSPATTASNAASKQKLDTIRVRGEQVPAAVRLKYEARIAAFAEQVELEAEANSSAVLERLANEFGMKPARLIAEHEAVAGSWGDLMIAHTLRSNVRWAITPAQVFDLHQKGMAWTMVAHGLGLDVDQFVTAVESESHVAIGDAKADGKVRAIGPADAGNTSVNVE